MVEPLNGLLSVSNRKRAVAGISSTPDARLCQLFIQQIQVLRSYIRQFHMSYSRKDALQVIPVPCQR